MTNHSQKFLYKSLTTLVALSLGGCGDAPKQADVASTQALSDALHINQRPDGNYNVTCRDGRYEIVTEADLTSNNVCVPAGPAPGTITLQDRVWNLSSYRYADTIEVFGKGLWEGWLTFHVDIAGDALSIVDGAGATFHVTTSRDFTRLKLPVTFRDGMDYSSAAVKITGISAEVTHVNNLPAATISGKFQMERPMPRTLIHTFASDLTGVQMAFRVDARFYDNFDSGTACGLIRVVGNDRTEILTPASPHRLLTLEGPIAVYSDVSCSSSRNPSPQNALADFDVGISSIALDP